MGWTTTGLTGVLDYKWAGNGASGGTWRLRATGPVDFVDSNSRPEVPPSIWKEDNYVKVVTLNALNFFTTIDGSGLTSGPNGGGPRGADSLEEFKRQIEKFLVALSLMNADVYSIQEIENEFLTDQNGDRLVAVEYVINELSKKTGERFDYVKPPEGYVGTDAITNALIYNRNRVKVIGVVDVFEDGLADPKNRAALTASFEPVDSCEDIFGEKYGKGKGRRQRLSERSGKGKGSGDKKEKCFTISSNHFKSKGSPCDEDLAGSPVDGTGSCNNVRVDFARALAEHIEMDNPTQVRCKVVAISGDLNSYASEAPIAMLESFGYRNSFSKSEYTYVFDGQIGNLDYFMADDLKYVEASEIWHINEDEAGALDYNLDFGKDPAYFDGTSPARYSDHSPIITWLDI